MAIYQDWRVRLASGRTIVIRARGERHARTVALRQAPNDRPLAIERVCVVCGWPFMPGEPIRQTGVGRSVHTSCLREAVR